MTKRSRVIPERSVKRFQANSVFYDIPLDENRGVVTTNVPTTSRGNNGDKTTSNSLNIMSALHQINWIMLSIKPDIRKPRPLLLTILLTRDEPVTLEEIVELVSDGDKKKLKHQFRLHLNAMNCEVRKGKRSIIHVHENSEGHLDSCCMSDVHLICNEGDYHNKRYWIDDSIKKLVV